MRLFLVPLVPAIVIVMGVAVAVAAGFLGIATLRNTSENVAQNRADVIASTLAPRLRSTVLQGQQQVIKRAVHYTGAQIILAGHDGSVLVNGGIEPPGTDDVLRWLVQGDGQTTTMMGRVAFAARPLGAPFETLAVVVLVPAPAQPEGIFSLVLSLIALTTLLLGVAGVVAFAVTRQIRSDVDLMRHQIEQMADPGMNATTIPLRIAMIDQVGALTEAFNLLMDRFSAARRAYQRDLEHAASLDRDRASFLAMLSHELRTPLNAILGFADVLLSEVDGPLNQDTRENLEMVRTSGSHLRGLIDDILELSALESGQLRLSPKLVDVHAIAENVLREASPWAKQKAIRFQLSGNSPTVVCADERRLWQVLSNLVRNAIKFTESGQVKVTTVTYARWVIVSVSDTGIGIDQQDFETIFEEFRQLPSSKNQTAGTGLGLFIARKLVQMHGGTIRVRSHLGSGSCFDVYLPAWIQHPPDSLSSSLDDKHMEQFSHDRRSHSDSELYCKNRAVAMAQLRLTSACNDEEA